jgi:hypothetical protein
MAPQTIPRYFYPRDPFLFFGWNEVKSVSWSSSLLLLYMSKKSSTQCRCCVCVETVRRAVENGRRLWSIHTLRRETTECLFDSFHADAAMYNTWPPVDLTRLSSISLLHSNKSAGQQQTEKKITSAQLSTLWWWGHWIFLIAIIIGIITSRRDLSSSPVLNNLLLLLRSMSEITTTTTTFSCVCVGLHSKAQIPFLFFCSD